MKNFKILLFVAILIANFSDLFAVNYQMDTSGVFTIYGRPPKSITGNNLTCAKNTQKYYTNFTSGITSAWSVTGGTIQGASDTDTLNVLWGASSSGLVTLIRTSSTGCKDTATMSVSIIPLPNASILGLNSVCPNTSNSYNTNSISGESSLWEVTGGTIQGSANSDNITVQWGSTTPGTVKLYKTITATGCRDSSTINVTINTLPKPAFLTFSDNVCEKNTYSFSANSEADLNYQWIIENGRITKGQGTDVISIRWDSVGILSEGKVTLIETNKTTGCKDSITKSPITIYPLPTVRIVGTDTVGVNGSDHYSSKDSNNVTSRWVVIGGTLASNPSNHYSNVIWGNAGIGILKLIQTDLSTTCQDTAILNVNILANPPLSISIQDSACELKTCTYSTASSTTIQPKWFVNNGTIVDGIDNMPTVRILWGAAGQGTLKLVRYLTDLKKTDSLTRYITIYPLPNPTVLKNSDTSYVGSKIKYWVSEPGKYLYQWIATNGTIIGPINKDTVEVQWNTIGKGTILLIATSKLTDCQVTVNTGIEIISKPNLIINGILEVCEGEEQTYKTADIAKALNEWYVTNGQIKNKTNTEATVKWGSAGTGKLKLIQNNVAQGLIDSTEISVIIHQGPIVSIPDFPDICLKDTIFVLDGGSPIGGQYFIDNIQKVEYNPFSLGAGIHTIRYEYKDTAGFGCKSYLEKTLNIHPEPLKPEINEVGDSLKVSSGSYFQWYYEDVAIPGANKSSIHPTQNGLYSVRAFDDIGCASKTSEVTYYPEGTKGAIIVGDLSIDFGNSKCEYIRKDTLNIQNPGTVVLNVTQVRIEGKDKDDFRFTTNIGGFDLGVKEKIIFPIEFSSNTIGLKEAEVVFTSNAINKSEFRVKLSAKKDSIGFSISDTVLKYEYLPENTPQMKELILTNTGSIPLNWPTTIEISKNFEIISIKPSQTPPNGGTSILRVIFNGEKVGFKASEFYTIKEDICNKSAQFRLSAIVGDRPIDAYAVIKVDSSIKQYKPGDLVEINIKLLDQKNIEKSKITGFTCELKFNSSLLVPTLNTDLGIISGNNRTISLKLPKEPESENILKTLFFNATLGSDTTTKLTLINLKSIGDSIDLSGVDGIFTLSGVCLEGGQPRLISTTGKVALNLIKPNPSNDKVSIEYEIIENGKTELYLVNAFGERVKTIFSKYATKGIYTIDYELKDLGTGMYFILLESPTVRKAEKLEVVR